MFFHVYTKECYTWKDEFLDWSRAISLNIRFDQDSN